ncbi:MAG TPA: thioesterase domain-containing protein [Ktedonobacterales bacterium]|nr:thioesterase domain-containing protein [Ktedonobacterales bacterium]
MTSATDTPQLSAAKRALLEKYLQGAHPQSGIGPPSIPASTRETLDPIRPSAVAVQPDGSKRPLFYIHIHAEGGAFYCFHLAQNLGADQPLYVIEPFRSAELRTMPSFKDMAAAYIASMRAIQPEGPYQLVGFCGGGLIAFEMAHQLRAQGQQVDLLVMIEPRAGPDLFRMLGPRVVCGLVSGVGAVLRRRSERRLDAFLALLHLYRFLRVRMLHPAYYRTMHARGMLDLPLLPNAELLHRNWLGIFIWLTSQYRPRPYPGKLIYLWSREEPSNRRAGKWGSVTKASEVEIAFIPGTQTTCRTEHLDDLAEQLRLCLARVQAAH